MILRLTSSTLALIVATAPAALALNADEVWATWENYLGGSGYTVAVGNREGGGDALTLTDVTLTIADEAAGSTTTITLPSVKMSRTGGGDIRSEFPEPMIFSVTGTTDAEGKPVVTAVEGNIDASHLETVSREEGGHQVDNTRGSEATVTLTRLDVDGKGPQGTPFTMVLRDIDSTNTYLGALNMLTESRIGAITGTLDMADPTGDANVTGQFTLGATEFSTEANIPEGHDTGTAAHLTEALRAGAVLAGKGSFASVDLDFAIASPSEGNTKLAMDSGTGTFDFALADGGLRYQSDVSSVNYDLQGDELPFPAQVALGAISMDIQFPLLASTDAQPFKLAYSLGDLTLNDAIWGLIDQKGALPHDPANLDLDLTGEILVHEDLLTAAEAMEGEDMEEAMAKPPIGPVALTLNQLALAAVGASATASGAVTFPDPANVEVAAGTLNAEFKGVNALLDKLVTAGFVTAEDLQGARMMMMMFAKPVDGQADTLRTELELKEDGTVFANGMQLK